MKKLCEERRADAEPVPYEQAAHRVLTIGEKAGKQVERRS
jgi:hypothetical protein